MGPVFRERSEASCDKRGKTQGVETLATGREMAMDNYASNGRSTILPFLPPLEWSPSVAHVLSGVALGPSESGVSCGLHLGGLIDTLRRETGLKPLNRQALSGLCAFFDNVREDAMLKSFFGRTLPAMATLLLKLPGLLLENWSKFAAISLKSNLKEDNAVKGLRNVSLSLRVLYSQQAGMILISQELAAALLVSAFFCLFPSKGRHEAELSSINFEDLFGSIEGRGRNSEQKLMCLVHYFSRISTKVPEGIISFERKVLTRSKKSHSRSPIFEPDEDYWSTSKALLCPLEVFKSGTIEDQEFEALEVDFANRFLGGGILARGCVQEEIRFSICPELIVGRLFLAAMHKHEAIEIVGAERFSSYDGYGSSFTFKGDCVDYKARDKWGRLQTRIVAIDALVRPSDNQYCNYSMMREINKAFCGFADHATIRNYNEAIDQVSKQGYFHKEKMQEEEAQIEMKDTLNSINAVSVCCDMAYHEHGRKVSTARWDSDNDKLGVATGNWGCGAFGGDPELKSLLQWVAASQASRPFLHYYTFGNHDLYRLEQLVDWILLQGWKVGELWGLLVDYGNKRAQGLIKEGLFDWVFPCDDS